MTDVQVPYLVKTKEGTLLRLHVQPRASRNKIVGIHGERLKIAVQAPPADGKANKAIQKMLAKTLDIPKAQVVLKSGASSREKSFLITGLSPAQILSKINQ